MASDQVTDLFELRHAATDHPTVVTVPERTLLAIDGVGPPRAADYRFASQTLRSVSDAIRRRVRERLKVDPGAVVLESVWWTHPELPADEMAAAYADRTEWHWQQLIEVPRTARDEDVGAAIEETRSAAGRPAPLVRVIQFSEGRAAQILHIGGSSTAAESVRRLFRAVDDAGLHPSGHLHEIHLVDEDRVPADRARSIIRLPVDTEGVDAPAE